MPKPSTLTDREAEIKANATHYSVVARRQPRQTFPTEAAAKAHGSELGYAVLYAVGPVCGVEASALISSCKAGVWTDIEE